MKNTKPFVTKYKSFSELKDVEVKNPNSYTEGDGVDHSRCYIYGKTELGRWMAPFYIKKFNFPVIGEFISVRNMWVWLTLDGHPDYTRHTHPQELETTLKSKQFKRAEILQMFTLLIVYAKYLQLMKYKPKLAENLPLIMYDKNSSGFRTTTSYSPWYINGVIESLNAYNEGRKPVYTLKGKKIAFDDLEKYIETSLMTDLFGERKEVIEDTESCSTNVKEENTDNVEQISNVTDDNAEQISNVTNNEVKTEVTI